MAEFHTVRVSLQRDETARSFSEFEVEGGPVVNALVRPIQFLRTRRLCLVHEDSLYQSFIDWLPEGYEVLVKCDGKPVTTRELTV